MKAKIWFVAIIATFVVVFNLVANNPFPAADPSDPDGGIGLWSIAFGLVVTMSYTPVLLKERYILTGLIFLNFGVVGSIICEAFVVFLLFSVAVSSIVVSSKEVMDMLLAPFKDEK